MDNLSISLIITSAILLIIAGLLFFKLRKAVSKNQEQSDEIERLNKETEKLTTLNKGLMDEREAILKRYSAIVDVEVERQKILGDLELNKIRLQTDIKQIEASHQQNLQNLIDRHTRGEQELFTLQTNIENMRQEAALLDETLNLQSFGFYKPHYSFESSSHYQWEIDRIREVQKKLITDKKAAVGLIQWTINNSIVEGRKQTNQTIKLILRAFNGECDAAIAKVKYNNVAVMQTRIHKAFEALNKLTSVQSIHITNDYLNAKLKELYLVHEYQEKVQEEKEEQRRIREEMREEEIARREIERALNEAEREETRYAEALRKATEEAEKAVGEKQAKLLAQIQLLQEKLTEAQANKERAISRAQMTRSGHVYVISNIGSFGEDIYKIGMTRRLDPMDRVRELGDASVPFRFDVHAVIYSEDAPTLENKLHKKFHERRVNQVNYRREFFRVSLDEITKAVHEYHGEIEFTLLAEADEYRKTVAYFKETNPVSEEIVLEL